MAKAVEKLNLRTFGKRLIEVFKQNLGKDNKKRGSLWKTVFWSTQMGKSHPTKKNKIHLYLSTAISPKLHLFRFYLYEKERPSTILQRIFSPRKKSEKFFPHPKKPFEDPLNGCGISSAIFPITFERGGLLCDGVNKSHAAATLTTMQ